LENDLVSWIEDEKANVAILKEKLTQGLVEDVLESLLVYGQEEDPVGLGAAHHRAIDGVLAERSFQIGQFRRPDKALDLDRNPLVSLLGGH
jgi:hypothetical protein